MTTILAEPSADHVVGDPRAEALLESFRIRYDLAEVKLDDLVLDAPGQVRDREHRAPAKRVREYQLQMEAGSRFPPIIVDRQGMQLLDGNTRVAAAARLGRETFPAYLIKCVDDEVRLSLAAALNQMGGERLSDQEATRAAEVMDTLGMTDDQVARYIGRSIASVRNYRAERKFAETAKAAGLAEDVMSTIPKAAQRKIGARVSHAEPFEAVVRLAAGGVKGQALEQAVKATEEAKSDMEAVAKVESLTAELSPQLPPPAGRVRVNTGSRATGYLSKFLVAAEGINADTFPLDLVVVWENSARCIASMLEALKSREQSG